MRRGSVLLNFSRDEIVDSAAVVAALDAGKLRAYVTDFPKRALLDHPKVICFRTSARRPSRPRRTAP